MRLGLTLGYRHRRPGDIAEIAVAAERLGYDSIWTSEAYGFDAVSPLAWIAARTRRIGLGSAILQMPARTPAMTAMTAVTLDFLSAGRLRLGLGVSGPQVVEGWHGVPFGKPLGRTREYVEILRRIFRREEALVHRGDHYEIPVSGGLGLGKPLKLISKPVRSEIPIYLAALGPRNVALTAEIADGWLPIFFSPGRFEVFGPLLEEGFARSSSRSLADLDIAPTVEVVLGPDVSRCRAQVKANVAFYVGGMGSKGRNFYNDLIKRYGYEEAAQKVQDLFLAGKRLEAAEAVPDELVDEIALCGPRERIAELLEPWRRSNVGTLICAPNKPAALEALAELLL